MSLDEPFVFSHIDEENNINNDNKFSNSNIRRFKSFSDTQMINDKVKSGIYLRVIFPFKKHI